MRGGNCTQTFDKGGGFALVQTGKWSHVGYYTVGRVSCNTKNTRAHFFDNLYSPRTVQWWCSVPIQGADRGFGA